MAYVQPTGVIQLFKGINLDNRYMHTLYFATKAQQTAFFDAFVTNGLSFGNTTGYQDPTAQMYTRPNRKTVRLHINAELVEDVTYMRFNNNRNNGNKRWYYCFVLGTNYVNENTTDVFYEIDVMQTWFFQNGSLQPCRVLREHVPANDDIFTHYLEPEPIGSDVYDFTQIEDVGRGEGAERVSIDSDFNGMSVILNTSAEPNSDNMLRDGIVNGTNFWALAYTGGSVVQIKSIMEQQLGSWDGQQQSASIIDMYMFPQYFAGYMDNNGVYDEDHQPHNTETYTFKHPRKYSNYVPQNKKLYGYPYSFLYITTRDGDAGEYHWEYFEGNVAPNTGNAPNITFKLNACASGGGSIEIHPDSYNGQSEAYDSKVVMNNFPKCAWSYDAYEAFIASGGQTKLSYQAGLAEKKGIIAKEQVMASTLHSIVSTGMDMADAIPKGGKPNYSKLIKGANDLTSEIINASLQEQSINLQLDEAAHKIAFKFNDARYQPDIVVGTATPNISVGKGYLCYKFYNAHVRDDEMVKLDNFLTMYGYQINDVKVPLLTGRPYWNFLQTQDCIVTGNMPASSKAAIAKIFDGGIFLWNSQNGTAANANSKIGNFRQQMYVDPSTHLETGQIVNK